MVVKHLHTVVAVSAVVGSGRHEDLTSRAKLKSVDVRPMNTLHMQEVSTFSIAIGLINIDVSVPCRHCETLKAPKS